MRILLAHNSVYYPSHGGGDKSNRLLMEALARRGHRVRVVARVRHFGEEAHAQLLGELAARGVAHDALLGELGEAGIRIELNGVELLVLTRQPHLREFFAAQMRTFRPDVILASTDDPAHVMYPSALHDPRARVVYLVRATVALPFGPDSAFPSEAKSAALRLADGAVAVSEHVARYARQWGGMEAAHVPISLLEPGAPEAVGRFENRFVTIINPCEVKGLAIFLALAQTFPTVEFAAVPTWGTTAADLTALRTLRNVTVIEPLDDVHRILAQSRVVLVPSLWAEARSRVILEAMVRGIPVLASDVGGLAEAKLGVDYLLPVNPVVRYRATVDELMVPMAEIPEQDTAPWQAALERLLTDREHYGELSVRSREAALEYAAGLTVEPFEAYLESVLRARKRRPALSRAARKETAPRALSPDKRRLLAMWLKQRESGRLVDR